MFSLGQPHQRPDAEPFPHSASYRSEEYFLQDAIQPHLHSGYVQNAPRSFAGDAVDRASYPHHDHVSPQVPTRRVNGSLAFGGLESVSVDAPVQRSYDRNGSHLQAGNGLHPISYLTQAPHSEVDDMALPVKRVGPSTQLDAYSPPSRATCSTELVSAFPTANSEHSGDSDFWPTPSAVAAPLFDPHPQTAPQKSKKSRREKPRIELAPDQPPTTQGKPRARVYVACLQCRTRKIRCDGAKPICHNCGRRANGNECNYDTVPKRRGPDRTPGARQRVVRNGIEIDPPSRRRRRTIDNPIPDSRGTPPERHPSAGSSNNTDPLQTHHHEIDGAAKLPSVPSVPSVATESAPVSKHLRSSWSPECDCHGLAECPNFLSAFGGPSHRKPTQMVTTYHDAFDLSCGLSSHNQVNRGFITELDEDGQERNSAYDIGHEPSLCFSRKIWWDSLLSLYISPSSTRLQTLTTSQRDSAAQGIASDLRFLFRSSNYWFSFFHIPTFFGNFFDPKKRERLQPSLVLAMLAMATFWQSSEIGFGKHGRERALRFRDEAQAAMDASFNAGWIDETLGQAAWLLSLFEVCAHPCHSSQRSTSSLVMLDSMIRMLALTSVDVNDPSTTLFSQGSVPAVGSVRSNVWSPSHPVSHSLPSERLQELPKYAPQEKGCSCRNFTLESSWPASAEHAPLWCSTPAWSDTWSEGEIRKESCRRLAWSSLILAAGHISYTTAARSQGLDLFIANPANYALLFSGESVTRSPSLYSAHSSKDTIWALHDRAFLLWNGCTRMRDNPRATEVDISQFAVKAWLEADSLEEALNRHTCGLERAFIFQAREYVFNTRMYISYEFRRYVPLATAEVNGMFHRAKAEEWLTRQATVTQRFMQGLHTITGNSNNLLARRPFFVFWFMGQIHRALTLYHCDQTLLVALDVCKALVPAIDYLTSLWPCPEQRRRYESLRLEVEDACIMAGIEPPPPCDLSLPSSPEALV